MFPILILTIHLCMSRYRDIIFDGIVEARDGERIMCAACLLMSLVKLLNTIRRLPIAVQHEASMRGVEPLGTLKKRKSYMNYMVFILLKMKCKILPNNSKMEYLRCNYHSTKKAHNSKNVPYDLCDRVQQVLSSDL